MIDPKLFVGKKLYCRTLDNRNLAMVLTSATPDYLVFKGANTGEYRVHTNSVLKLSDTPTPLKPAEYWQE